MDGIMKICFSIYVCLCVWLCVVADPADPVDPGDLILNRTFHAIDVNHDNVLSNADIQLLSQTFTDMHSMSGDEATAVYNMHEAWWVDCFQGQDETRSEQQFVDAFTQAYSDDPDDLKTHITSCLNTIVGIFDFDNDAKLSKEEFLIYFKSFGYNNEATQELLFRAFTCNRINKKVQIKAYVAFIVELFSNDEKSVIYDALINGA